MQYLLILSALFCFGYSAYVKIKYKVNSISESYYHIGPWFITWTMITAITLLPAWLEITPESFQFLAFLSSASLMFVGGFPKFLSKDKIPHYILAGVAIILSILWSILIGTWYIPFILISLTILINYKKSDLIYWVEIASIISIYLEVFIKILN